MRLLVTRPKADSGLLMQLLERQGHEALLAPLLDIRICDGDELALDGVQAILLTSANGARAFAVRSSERDLAAYCVGDATAREALRLGFEEVKSASGDVTALAELVKAELKPADGALVHPAGTRVAGDLAGLLMGDGYAYRREVLYEAIKAENLPDVARAGLEAGTIDGVLLYSPRTAAAFAQLIDRAGLGAQLQTVQAYCLSQAVADQIEDLTWGAVHVAERPEQASLLALLEK